MKDPKNIPLLLIPYLTICSVLYHIAFWDTFNLNGLLFISVSDILKSAVQPIALVFITSIGTLLFVYYFLGFGKLYPIGGGQNSKLGKAVNTNIGKYLSLLLVLIYIIFTYFFRKDPERWSTLGFFIGLPIWIFLFNKSFLLNEIPNLQFRFFVIQYLVYLPLLSFATGKKDSEIIYKNIRYKYVVSDSTNKIPVDTLKFIGASSQNFIFTNLNNSTTIIIMDSSIDTLILKENK